MKPAMGNCNHEDFTKYVKPKENLDSYIRNSQYNPKLFYCQEENPEIGTIYLNLVVTRKILELPRELFITVTS